MLIRRLLFLLTAVSALVSAQVTPQRLDAQVQAYVNQEQFNGAVLVVANGKPILSKGYGMASFEWSVPNAPETKFRLGSVTKQFTAMAVLLLEQQGKLSVQDPLCKFVDPCPDAWKPVTLHHLLTHTSGIPNFTGFPDYLKTMAMPSPPAESIKRFRDKPLDFPPGSKWSYSNSGYVLLGYIIEKTSGVDYASFLRKNILDPFGMTDTGYDSPSLVLPHRASGYSRTGGTLRNADYIDMSIPHAAGALYSTTLDLWKWDQALTAARLLTPASYKRYFTPGLGDYAYGWSVKQQDGVTVISHGGGINGFATMIERVPEKQLLVVTLSNVLPSQAGKLAADLRKLALGQEVETPKPNVEVKLPSEVLRQYVGEYELNPNFIVAFTLEDGMLYTQATGQPKFPVFAKSETTFFLKVVEAELTFQKDPSGKIAGVVIVQGGARLTLKRR